MKKLMLLILNAAFILTLFCSCKSETVNFNYRIDDFQYFSELLNKPELSSQQGEYTITINGLDTPVVFYMEGMSVVKVAAYNKTAMTDIDVYQDYCPADIEGVTDAVIISEDLDYESRCWVFTKDKIYKLAPENGVSTRIFAKDDKNLGYTRYWGEYITSFDQWETAPLDLCKSREQFLYENGVVHISDGRFILSPEKTVKLQDVYELDDMFKKAKENGMYAEYNTVDELFADNASK